LALAAGVASAGLAADPFPAVIELSELSGKDGFVIRGEATRDYAGYSVSRIGDCNGDGYDDLLVGAPRADVAPRLSEGKAYVIFGGPEIGGSGVLPLAGVDETTGVVLLGKERRASTGSSLGRAGDFNADGIDDILVGAPGAVTTELVTGETFVVFGSSVIGNAGQLDLETLDGENGFALLGIDAYDYSGQAVQGLGDVNGDGIADAIIGASEADPEGQESAGESYVVFGGATVGAKGAYPLNNLRGPNGFKLDGINAEDDSGEAVAGAGDINADGFGDILIGAATADPVGVDRAGEAYVVFGGSDVGANGRVSLSSLDGKNGFTIVGRNPLDFLGQSVAGVGDINGDGVDDFAVSAHRADGMHIDIGETYVIFGEAQIGDTGVFDPASLNGENGFVVRGPDVNDVEFAGYAVDGAGDVNGDGFADLLISAPLIDVDGGIDAGGAYVVFGAIEVGHAGVFDLGEVNGRNGFAMNGVSENDNAGISASGAGDVNGDGIDDVVIGADGADVGGNTEAGEAYVVFGRALDSDSDGLMDRDDNCTLVANFDQRDTDGDGYGNDCDPDLDGDLLVDFTDLGLFKSVFLTNDPDADFDGSGVVNFADLGTMKSYFLKPPGPSGLTR
jgi:hypothetical protein